MKRNVTLITAVSIVVTNMIGTGILTTPGVLCSYLTSTGQVMLVWIAGGLIALLGAVVYGQMGSLMPHSGGEYHYLSHIYHPKLGMAAGWVSVIAGFAGPIALSAMAFAKYMMNLPFVHQFFSNTFSIDISEKIIALLLIFSLSLFHVFRKRAALNFQVVITVFLIAFLLIISFLGFRYGFGSQPESLSSSYSGIEKNFGMALLLSVYSYTGWNASCYFAGEILNPKRNLPLSLVMGVSLVIGLYLAVNYGLMKVLGIQQLSGQVDFLSQLGNNLSGKSGSQLISVTVLVILLASISSMIYTGSRIPILKKRSLPRQHPETGEKGIVKMFVLQITIAFLFILFTGFLQLLLILTLVLTFFSILTAYGIFLLPWKKLKVTKIHEGLVKFSAAALLVVLIWLVANSLREFRTTEFWMLLIAILTFVGLVLFRFFRQRVGKFELNKLNINLAKGK
jgi:APA family basic amino acid/polyamine antiporter